MIETAVASLHSHTGWFYFECHRAAGRQFLGGRIFGKRIGVSCQGHVGTGSTNNRSREDEDKRGTGNLNESLAVSDNNNNNNIDIDISSSSVASSSSSSDHGIAPRVSLDKHNPEQAFQSRSELWRRRIRLLLKYSAIASVAVLVAGLTAATPLAANASSIGQSVRISRL